MSQAYPLSWPIGWPRTLVPGKATFADRTVHQAVEGVTKELEMTKATDIVISSNYTLGPAPKDKGVCVYFKLKGKPYALPCDKWTSVEDNLWAVAKHVESLRLQGRWGVGNIERAFAGYLALPQHASARDWRAVLGVLNAKVTYEEARQAFLRKAQQVHPDMGGTHQLMAEVNDAWNQAEQYFKAS